MATNKLEILITAKDEASKEIKGVSTLLGGLGKLAGIGLAAAAAAGTAALVGLGAGLKFSMEEAIEAEEVMAQLEAVLKSTGGVAGITAEMADNLATSLSQVTRFDDEAILSGESLLLTFTNIGSDIFPQATEAMLNMSQALGQDLKSSAVQLGKALQDPILGVTALRRVGVNFNEEQVEMIKTMVEAGDVMGAQTYILKELETEFGNSAKAAGGTFAGQMDIFRNSLSNVAEGIGMVLLPALSELMTEFAPMIQELANSLAEFVKSEQFKQWLTDTVAWIKNELIPWVKQAAVWFRDDFIPAVKAIWAIAGPILGFLGKAFMFLWKFQIEPLIQFFKNQKAAINDFFYLFEAGKQLLEGVATRLKEIFENIKGTFQTKMDEIKLLFSIDKWIAMGKNIVEGIAQGIGNFTGILRDAIFKMASSVMDWIKDSLGIEHSPSEITKKFGADLAAGIAVGFGGGMKSFNASLGKMGGIDTMVPAFSAAPASNFGAVSGSSQVVVNINAPILGFRDEYELGAKLGPIVDKYLKSHR